METPENIRVLARLRLAEARVLAQNDLPDGAYYLAGYSVELTLKAKVAERLGLPGVFDEQSTDKFDGISDLRRFLKTHNVRLLLTLSGLRLPFEQAFNQTADGVLFAARLNLWSEGLRYRTPGRLTVADVQAFIANLDGPTGFLQWIESN